MTSVEEIKIRGEQTESDQEAIEIIKRKDFSVNYKYGLQKRTVFYYGCESGRMDVVKALRAQEADFDIVDGTNQSGLMRAIINGHHNLCYYLINEVKVNISQKDVSNHSAFYFASKNDFLEILEALVNREDDPIPGASLVLQYLVQEETPETN